MLVLRIAERAPRVLALPSPQPSEGLSESTISSIDQIERKVPRNGSRREMPVVAIPFDVLRIALDRSIDLDLADAASALGEVEARHGALHAKRHAAFLADLAGTQPERELQLAMTAIDSIANEADLLRAIEEHPALLTEAARRAAMTQVRHAGNALARDLATARLRMLERSAMGDVPGGWAAQEAALRSFKANFVQRALVDEWEAFNEAVEHDFEGAIELGEVLVTRAAELGLATDEAKAAYETAMLYERSSQRQPGAALERCCQLLERALSIIDSHPRLFQRGRRLAVLQTLAVAVARRSEGDPEVNQRRAIALNELVLEMTSKDTDGRSWALAHTNLGLSQLQLVGIAGTSEGTDDYRKAVDEAIDHFELALTWRTFEREPRDWALTQINLALAYSRHDAERARNLRAAIEHDGQAARGFEKAREPELSAWALGNRAGAELALALLSETTPSERDSLMADAEHDARNALAIRGEAVDGVQAGMNWWQLGEVLAARSGYTDEFVGVMRRALSELQPEIAPHACREAGFRLGEIAASAAEGGGPGASDAWAIAAEGWVQAARAATAAFDRRGTRSGRFAEIGSEQGVFRCAAYALIRVGMHELALEMLELGRAREASRWLDREAVDLAPLREADEMLCARFVDLRARTEERGHAGGDIRAPAFARLIEEMDQTIRTIRRLPGLEDFLRQPNVTDLLGALPTDETIAFPVTSPVGSAWLLVHGGADVRAPITAVDLPSLTSSTVLHAMGWTTRPSEESYIAQLTGDGERLDDAIETVGSLLGPALMRPLSQALRATGAESVCLVPIHVFGLLPLQALTWRETEGKRCLLDDVAVTNAPSAYVRGVCRQRASGRSDFLQVFAIGNPMPQSGSPIPSSEHEAELVSRLVPADSTVIKVGVEATKEAVLESLPVASHIHLACHATAAAKASSFDSALWLDHDRALSAPEILGLDLSRARLVVASACETGKLPGYDALDESMTISTLFLGAGAAGVVATLWSVWDYATALLMARFYEELVSDRDQPARALRAAQLWLRDLKIEEEELCLRRHPELAEARPQVDDDSDRRFSAPTAWSGFVFSGA